MSHTPGPWVVIDDRQVVTLAEVEEGRTYGYGCGDDFICDLNDGEYHEYRSEKEQAANARLIAAAPELLEALQDLTAQIRIDANADCLKLLLGSKEYRAALTAIAKATGEGA